MRVVFTGDAFRCVCSYVDRKIPQEAGFRWDNQKKCWYTPDPKIALRLESYLDQSAAKEIARTRIRINTWTKPLIVPKSESLLPYQENSVLFALSRNRSYLALDPGLGKTLIAAVITATLFEHEGPRGVVYICPPFLTRNTEVEFRRFAPKCPVGRYGEGHHKWVMIVPDSIITREEVQTEILKRIKPTAKALPPILFIDEAHRFKNDEAARTQAVFGKRGRGGITSLFERVIYLSGTPMPNRPIELYPVLSNAAPETIDYMTKHQYAERYCSAFQNQWGWDYTGASNVRELTERVREKFMIRYKKADVLKELPPKTEEMVVLNGEMIPKFTKLSAQILSKLSPDDLMKGRISADLGQTDVHLATYRKELGILKAPAAAEFVKFILEETDESVLIFAIHKEAISILEGALEEFHPVVITGDTDMNVRHQRVKAFQERPDLRVFIGNIQAAGTGLTLTKATRVVFVEFSWVPADNDQASDRAHRIGQQGNVFVQYLVHENSVDKAVIETVLRKKKVTDQL